MTLAFRAATAPIRFFLAPILALLPSMRMMLLLAIASIHLLQPLNTVVESWYHYGIHIGYHKQVGIGPFKTNVGFTLAYVKPMRETVEDLSGGTISSPLGDASLEAIAEYEPLHGQSYGPETGNLRDYDGDGIKESPHAAVDLDGTIGAQQGAPVLSPVTGEIVAIENWSGAGVSSYQVVIEGKDHKGKVVHKLGHVNNLAVSTGDRVKAGQHVAAIAPTDQYSSGPHLDWKVESKGKNVNPQTHIQDYLDNKKNHTPPVSSPIRKGDLPVVFDINNGSSADEIEAIINAAINLNIEDVGQISYILATAEHESASFSTMHEIGANGYCGSSAWYDGWAGVGLVQLTWEGNHEKAKSRLGFDDLSTEEFCQEVATRPDVAATILIEGMMRGWFTGLSLPQFVSGGQRDYIGARAVVNGSDKAGHIAGITREYEPIVEERLSR